MRRANEARASVSEAEVAAFGETLIFGGLAPRIAGSTAPKGSKVFAFMLKKTLGVETATALLAREDKDTAMDEARFCAGTDSRGRCATCPSFGRGGEDKEVSRRQSSPTRRTSTSEAPSTRSRRCSTRDSPTSTRR